MSTHGERNERCETCRFWVTEASECHRHAHPALHWRIHFDPGSRPGQADAIQAALERLARAD